jgi:HAD superfamily hydrolase (TIGR01459 family)
MNTLAEIILSYDALLVDLWGVIHDGTALYPGVNETLAYVHAHNKPVIFLSNAPRVSAKAVEVLDRLGIDRAHYQTVITSGQVAHDLLAGDPEWLGTNYYYLGPSKDEDILSDLSEYMQVNTPEEADFVLNTGYEFDFQPHEEVLPLLKKLLALKLPLLCVNPDHEVVKIDGTQMLCAGTLADAYAEMGGLVEYIGKPFDDVYDRAITLAGTDKILCIGDNPLTDILGAQEAGLDSVLITGGILAIRGEEPDLDAIGATYVLPRFGLVE